MKKLTFRLFSVLSLFLLVFALVSCKPDNADEARERLEEKGYTVTILTGTEADLAFAYLDDVAETVTAIKGSTDNMFVAILFDSEDAAEKAKSELEVHSEYEVHQSGKWVYSGSDEAVEAFE